MKKIVFILFFAVYGILIVDAQEQSIPDFTWSNASYFNINIGESIYFNNTEVKLLNLENHFNQLKIGRDTVWMKVSRRTLPTVLGNVRIFVADNKNVKALDSDIEKHGLLKKDALICISDGLLPLLDRNKYLFPISFNDGFLWSSEEDSYMFSYLGSDERKSKDGDTFTGIDFDLNDARGIKKHWIVAIENSKVIWIEEKNPGKGGKEADVLLESEAQQGIYYLYKHLNKSNIEIKRGQKLERGEPIGTIWGDEVWGHLTFSVIKSDTVPLYEDSGHNVINCFPQIFELYFKESIGYPKSYTKGRIFFGKPRSQNGNQKNASAFELYSGKGWILGKWNTSDKVDWAAKGNEGNVRLGKTLFKGTAAQCTNPDNFYDYEINVQNGVYRIRAKMGDVNKPTWQEIAFNGVSASELSEGAGQFAWTPEKVVKVIDGKLTIRIFVDGNNEKPAGISEIVFQRAY